MVAIGIFRYVAAFSPSSVGRNSGDFSRSNLDIPDLAHRFRGYSALPSTALHTFFNLLIIYIVFGLGNFHCCRFKVHFGLQYGQIWFNSPYTSITLVHRAVHFIIVLTIHSSNIWGGIPLAISKLATLHHHQRVPWPILQPVYQHCAVQHTTWLCWASFPRRGVCWTPTNLILPLNGASVTLSKPSLQSYSQPFPQFFPPY